MTHHVIALTEHSGTLLQAEDREVFTMSSRNITGLAGGPAIRTVVDDTRRRLGVAAPHATVHDPAGAAVGLFTEEERRKACLSLSDRPVLKGLSTLHVCLPCTGRYTDVCDPPLPRAALR